MQGTSVIKGTRYVWNIDYKGDMPGTMVTIGTRYVWNFDKNRDLVCLEHQSNLGPDMPGTLFDGD